MKKSTIIQFIKNNIEKYGSFSGGLHSCKLCIEADKRTSPTEYFTCKYCPLWDYLPKPKFCGLEAACSHLKYKGEAVFTIESRLEGNKPALRAFLRGLINFYSKGAKK